MPWDLDSDRPIFIQLVERMMDDIFAGRYTPGGQFPSVRDLALDAAVNPNTMQKALAELERTGLVFTKRTSGRFVTEDTELINRLKHERAGKMIDSFITDMKNIGIERDEIISIISSKGEQ